ncbi:hypothetical protein EH220_01185 [bacterium]|nr:MAG: hypothetical protein EH220_01185 [bacterium]
MKISLNGLDLPKIAEGPLTVREVLKELQSEIHASGKLLLKAVLDGVPLSENWDSDYRMNTPVDRAKHLELIIDEPKHAAQQLLKDSCALIERLTMKTGELARKFRIGSEVVANNELVEFLDELKLLLTGLDVSTRQTDNHPEFSRIRSRMEMSAAQLAPTLDRIYHAQSSGDTVSIADEIQYELPTQMNSLKDLLTETTRVMNAKS